ncbi:MAG: hypothetical protein IJ440_01935, partial [Alphaproteobacteria bacterium]|nr:hypothetical protein [Alphaproteobacteria bacterium]
LCCTHVGENGECCDSNNKCCPADKPLRDKDGNCYACDDETQVNVEGMVENCAVCSNRLVSGSKKHCVLKCGLKGTSNENKPLMDTDGKCHACDEEAGVNVKGVESNCDICSKEGRYVSNAGGDGNYCVLCGVKGSSVEKKPLLYWGGTCTTCTDNGRLRVINAETCIKTCPNRIASNSLHCGLNPCSGDTPLHYEGKCYACDYGQAIPLMYLPEGKCKELCKNRKAENGQCVLESCPADKPLMDASGGCHACDEEAGVNVKGVEDNCKVCSSYGRYVSNAGGNGNYCVLCGVKGSSVENKPLIYWATMGDGGTHCTSCNDKNKLRVISAETCIKTCPNRYAVNSLHCGLDYCTEDVPLMDIDKNCHPCNEPLPVDVGGDETKCGSCLNRTLDGQYCILNSNSI